MNPLLNPIISEKTTAMVKDGKYLFLVRESATKVDIRNAFVQLYGVPVAHVNVIRQPRKTKLVKRGITAVKRPYSKKAIITTKGKKTVDVYKVGGKVKK